MLDDTSPEAQPIGERYTIKERSEVAELTVTASGLRVVVATSPFGSLEWILLEYFFGTAAGIRCLDTADLRARRSDEPLFEPGYHLFRVSRGGWLDQELQTPGMLTVTFAVGAQPEWFVTTKRQSVNVVGPEPLVREYPCRVGWPVRSQGGVVASESADSGKGGRSREGLASGANALHLAAQPTGRAYSGSSSDIVELALAPPDPGGLRVVVATSPDGSHETVWVEYLFTRHHGFRYLDEGDLTRFWESGVFRSGHHLYRITSGGWLDQEFQVPGMFSAPAGLQEWFIATGNHSVSVAAGAEPPLVREFRGR
jgi:hypothetical protein